MTGCRWSIILAEYFLKNSSTESTNKSNGKLEKVSEKVISEDQTVAEVFKSFLLI